MNRVQDDARNLREDVSGLQRKDFEDFAKLDQSIDKGTEKIETAIAKRLDKYSADMNRAVALQNSKLENQGTEIEDLVSVTTRIRRQLILLQNQRVKGLQIGMISRPSLLRSVCEQYDQSDNYAGSYSAASDRRARLPRSAKNRGQHCDCHLNLVGSASKSYRLGFTRNLKWRLNLALQLSNHRPLCPLSRTYSVSVERYGALLAGAVEALFSITCGAGGLSISPVIQCLRVVSADSPVFQLVDWSSVFKAGIVKSTTDFDIYLRNNISKIERLFENGEASPYDVDSRRHTLLHVRIGMILLFDTLKLTVYSADGQPLFSSQPRLLRL